MAEDGAVNANRRAGKANTRHHGSTNASNGAVTAVLFLFGSIERYVLRQVQLVGCLLINAADFLRFSRSAIDDSINQNLNALVTPSRTGFDPASTSHRNPSAGAKGVGAEPCANFRKKVLFPSWQSRADALEYCAAVASSPDPDDPGAALRELEDKKNQEKVVDERLDPYSARYFPRESRTEALATLVRQEKGVESIVRHRSWEVIQQRCNAPEPTWEKAFGNWKQSNKEK